MTAAFITLAGLGAPAAYAADTVVPDTALAACINAKLSRGETTPITGADVASMSGQLMCTDKGVARLDGLEFATGLTGLSLNGNSITDASPLKGLTKLTTLQISQNNVSDLGPLSGLVNLTQLSVHYNSPELSSLAPLAGLTKLTLLNVNLSKVSDLSPLSGMTNLTDLTVNNSLVSDVTPIARLPLQYVALSGNNIADVSPLSELSTLSDLRIPYNEIGDLSSFRAAPSSKYAISQEPVLSPETRYVPVGATSYRTAFNWAPKSWGGTLTNAGSYDSVARTVSDAGEAYAGVVRDYAITSRPYLTTYFASPIENDSYTGVARVQISPAEFTSDSPATAALNTPYAHDFTVTDGFPVAGWAVTSGDLPSGLTLTSDGRIEGTPTTEGRFPFTVTATDTWGNTLSSTVELTVGPAAAPTISLAHDRLEAGQTQTVTGTGFRPGEKVTGTIRTAAGATIDLGAAEADADGKVVFNFDVPADAALGEYTAELAGDGDPVSANFEVVEAARHVGGDAPEDSASAKSEIGGGLAQTGADSGEALWGSVAALVVGVAVMMLARKRRMSPLISREHPGGDHRR